LGPVPFPHRWRPIVRLLTRSCSVRSGGRSGSPRSSSYGQLRDHRSLWPDERPGGTRTPGGQSGAAAHRPASVLYAVADLVVDEYGGPPRVYAATSTRSSWPSSPASGLNPPNGCTSSNARCWNSRGPYSRCPPRWTPSSVAGWAWSIPPIAAYFRDVYDHVLRAADQISGLDQLLSGALTANLTQIQVRQKTTCVRSPLGPRSLRSTL
jgi:hypothetical protein